MQRLPSTMIMTILVPTQDIERYQLVK